MCQARTLLPSYTKIDLIPSFKHAKKENMVKRNNLILGRIPNTYKRTRHKTSMLRTSRIKRALETKLLTSRRPVVFFLFSLCEFLSSVYFKDGVMRKFAPSAVLVVLQPTEAIVCHGYSGDQGSNVLNFWHHLPFRTLST